MGHVAGRYVENIMLFFFFFSRFKYHMFYVLCPFLTYLLILSLRFCAYIVHMTDANCMLIFYYSTSLYIKLFKSWNILFPVKMESVLTV
jgi:hypothetical protein